MKLSQEDGFVFGVCNFEMLKTNIDEIVFRPNIFIHHTAPGDSTKTAQNEEDSLTTDRAVIIGMSRGHAKNTTTHLLSSHIVNRAHASPKEKERKINKTLTASSSIHRWIALLDELSVRWINKPNQLLLL